MVDTVQEKDRVPSLCLGFVLLPSRGVTFLEVQPFHAFIVFCQVRLKGAISTQNLLRGRPLH